MKYQASATTLTGENATSAARPPTEAAFRDGELFLSGDAIGYTDLYAIGHAIAHKYPELSHLQELSIGYLWRKKGTMRAGKPVYGAIKRHTGALRFHSRLDFELEIAADHAFALNARQLEATIYRELLKIEWDDEEQLASLRGFDTEMFYDEISRYGLWHRGIEGAADAIKQLRLDMDGEPTVSPAETNPDVIARLAAESGDEDDDENPDADMEAAVAELTGEARTELQEIERRAYFEASGEDMPEPAAAPDPPKRPARRRKAEVVATA